MSFVPRVTGVIFFLSFVPSVTCVIYLAKFVEIRGPFMKCLQLMRMHCRAKGWACNIYSMVRLKLLVLAIHYAIE